MAYLYFVVVAVIVYSVVYARIKAREFAEPDRFILRPRSHMKWLNDSVFWSLCIGIAVSVIALVIAWS